MGAWAADAFGNDTALDWVPSVERARTWKPVQKALKAPVTDDATAAEVALAAAEVVAAGRGSPADEVPDEVEAFVARAGAPPADLIEAAQRRVREVTADGSELRALWLDSPSRDAWLEATDDLHRRLAGLPAPPRPDEPPGPLVPWPSTAVQDWLVRFHVGDDWTVAGRALMDANPFHGTARGTVRFRGLAAVEAVCAALGRPAADLPTEVAEAVARLGMPAMFVLRQACSVAAHLAVKEVKRRGELPPAWVDLLVRLRGCDAEAVRRDPDGRHPAAAWTTHARDLRPGRKRKGAVEPGDVVALRYPQGWVVGRCTPAPRLFPGGWWVWLYEGFRSAPDDLTGATFARRWAGPRAVELGVIRGGWLELQDPALRAYDDGAPELPRDGRVEPVPKVEGMVVDRSAADHVGTLDDEVRLRSGVGFRELVETKVRHYLVHGVIEQCPGDTMHPGYVWRRDLFFADRAVVEPLAREIRDAIPAAEVDAMRRAWVAHAEAAAPRTAS